MRTLRFALTAVLALAAARPLSAQGAPADPQLAGHWEGAIVIVGQELAIAVDIRPGPGGVAATIDIPQQGARGLPLGAVRLEPPRVRFELQTGGSAAVFDGRIDGDRIAGSFTQHGITGDFHLTRSAPPRVSAATPVPPPYLEEEVAFTSTAGSFAGTLTAPRGGGRHPAVVLLTGSGPQDRDETILGFGPFRLIADHLTRKGIAVLRYDDRGVGGTTAAATGATTADFADDALAAVAFLKTRPEIDGGRIGLLGHSEGGIVAPLAATRSGDVAFVVMLSGMGVTGERILLDQAEAIARAGGAGDVELAAEERLQRMVFAAVRAGSGWEAVEAEARKLALAQLETLPAEQRQALGDLGAYAERLVAGQMGAVKTPWFKYFLDYDPAPALTRLRCPVLALFGELDLQVPAASNAAAVRVALAQGRNTDATVTVIPGANHLYQAAHTGTPAEYAGLEKAFAPGLLETISSWVLARFGGGR